MTYCFRIAALLFLVSAGLVADTKVHVCFYLTPRPSPAKNNPLPGYTPSELSHQNKNHLTNFIPPSEFNVRHRGLLDVSEISPLPLLYPTRRMSMNCPIADIEADGAISVH
jgi:hypothetical protein